jgi:hypothetical protein
MNEKVTLRRRPTFVDGALGVTALALVVAIGLQIFVLNPKADSTERGLRNAVGAIIAVQIQNCRADHRFREQYKTRGEAEKAILGLFLSLAHKAVREAKDPEGVSRQFIQKFGPLNRRIHIIPVPDCDEVARRLRKVVENTGVKVPPIPDLEALVSPAHLRRSAPEGGDAQQTGSTGHQQPSPSPSGGGGDGTEAGKGGGKHESTAATPVPEPKGASAGGGSDPARAPASGGSSAEQSRETPAPSTNEAADPESHPIPEAVEAAGGAVGTTGEAAQGVVEGAGKAAGCVLRGSC